MLREHLKLKSACYDRSTVCDSILPRNIRSLDDLQSVQVNFYYSHVIESTEIPIICVGL